MLPARSSYRIAQSAEDSSVPTYQYACTECDNEFEQFQAFSDAALTVCAVCGGRLRKVYGSVGVVFKGSGFYRTDSRNGDGKVAKADGAAKSGSEKSSTADSGTSTGSKSTESPGGSGSGGSGKESSGGSGSGSGSAGAGNGGSAKSGRSSAGAGSATPSGSRTAS
jgi:putative FmdB family regulatory protein